MRAAAPILLAGLLACLSAGKDKAEPPAPHNATAAAALPPDVTAFIARRDRCDHFRGEEAYDEERGRFLARQIQEFCTGTDAALAKLRQQHAKNPAALEALRGYEDRIE